MTERQKEAHDWKEKGLKIAEIARKMGISRQRVFHLLNPEKNKAYQKAYQKGEKYKAYKKAYWLRKKESLKNIAS